MIESTGLYMQVKQPGKLGKTFSGLLKKKEAVKRKARELFYKSPPHKELAKSGKIGDVIKLKNLCRYFGVPFEPITVFKREQKFKIDKFKRSERILVRLGSHREEFVLKGADKRELKFIENSINRFIKAHEEYLGEKYIVQRVGLVGDIERYGSIFILKQGKIIVVKHGEIVPRNPLKRATIFMTEPSNEIDLKNKAFFKQKFGNHNLIPMIEHIAKNITDTNVRLRFVKYNGKEPCFYDMKATHL